MLINMTPHAVNIIAEDGAVTVPPSGVVPRVTWDRRGCGTMAVEGIEVPVTAYSGDPHVDPPARGPGGRRGRPRAWGPGGPRRPGPRRGRPGGRLQGPGARRPRLTQG